MPKFLILEDDESAIDDLNGELAQFIRKTGAEIAFEYATNLDDAKELLKGHVFDGVIVDLNINGDEQAGNRFIAGLVEDNRIPIFVHTGQGHVIDSRPEIIAQYIRGDCDWTDILERMVSVYNTGACDVLGLRGAALNLIDSLFWNDVIPNIQHWEGLGDKEYGINALMRYLSAAIYDYTDSDPENVAPAEMYLALDEGDIAQTGALVKHKETESRYVVITPACDLAQGDTDTIQLCEIQRCEDAVPAGHAKMDKKRSFVERAVSNNKQYLHFLPRFSGVDCGVINFRKLRVEPLVGFADDFEGVGRKISPMFMKDIVARFSAYYARQGQPGLNHDPVAFSREIFPPQA